ncbi:MAG: hypothetical protein P8Y29_12260 [Gemmatimonadota bacterium]
MTVRGRGSRPVVSADDVRAVHRDGSFQLVVPENAIVTPLAREEADRHGIELVEPGKTPNPSPGLVPEADATQVRQIAERVLARWGQ